MLHRLTPTIALVTLAFAAAACADGSTIADEAPPTTAPPTTAPPTTAPPTTAPPATDPPATDPPTTTPPDDAGVLERYVEIDDGAFGSIGEMAEAADVVVVATVSDELPVVSDRDDVVPIADELLDLRLRVDEVLKGEPGDAVTLTWFAFGLDEDGERVATNLLNGIPVPRRGDQLVLFLRSVTDENRPLLGGATHTPVMLDGVGFLRDGAVTITDDVVPEAAVLTGVTLDEIRSSV